MAQQRSECSLERYPAGAQAMGRSNDACNGPPFLSTAYEDFQAYSIADWCWGISFAVNDPDGDYDYGDRITRRRLLR